MKLRLLFGAFCILFTTCLHAQEKSDVIKWMSFQEAVKQNSISPRKILIDMYTDWCGWCKKLDATTYMDAQIIDYLNKNYYAVRMNAEMKDTILFDGKLFINPEPNKSRSTHQIASALLGGKLSYPTLVYLDEKMNMLSQVPGFMTAQDLLPVLKYFGENYQTKISWEDYQKAIINKQ